MENINFKIKYFNDDYDKKCSIQESFSVEPHIWLGSDTAESMYLNRKQSRELAKDLLYFARHGKIKNG